MSCFICAAQLKFDFKLTSEARIQPVFTGREDMPVAFDFSHQGHALVTHYVQFLCFKWSKFDVFTCLFPLDVQSEILLHQEASTVFCYSQLVCLLGFWLRNTSLEKVGNLISDDIVFVFHLA